MRFSKFLNRRARARNVANPQSIGTISQCPSRVTIGKLSDKVLLNIFCHYLDASPRLWPRLVHICRRWRRIVFASQRALHLRLLFMYGTPALKSLECWPTLPIVVQYGGSLGLEPPVLEDEENIIAALKQSDRVSYIGLTVTYALLEKFSTIERPFLVLEDLVLLSRNSVTLTLPSSFQWGPRLRRLHLTSIASPTLLQLLSSSRNLVDLQLHEVLNPVDFSPKILVNALSGMVQLRSLSLHFLYTAKHIASPPPSGKRVILPVLTRLNFRGFAQYLEGFVARVDAPHLGDIEVTFFNGIIFYVSEFGKFIDRIEMQKSHSRADILSSENGNSISFTQPGATTRHKLKISHKPSSCQRFSIIQVLGCFSAFLFGVEDLHIHATRPSWRDSLDSGQWLKLINSFTGVKRFHITGNLSTTVVRALQLSEMRRETVLPALHKLSIPQPGPRHAPLTEAVVSLVISRRLSGHPIAVEYKRRGTGNFSQLVTTEVLSDDILLNIFRHCLDATPRIWPTLVWVCQRWRQAVFASPLGLNLRLFCTYGTPVLKILDCWPALPIIVQYGGSPNLDPPAPEDDNNIISALKLSGRVSSISLTVTSSLLENLSAISGPFLELEELALLSQDNMQLALPSTFRWGPRLRTLHSTKIAFPSFPQLLLPSQDLVDLQLNDIPSAGYFSPEAFVDALSGTPQLRTLSLHFLSLPPRRNFLHLPPQSGERVVLPALTYLKYRGTSKYLDSLVARIDAPRLEDIDITFFSQPTMDAWQLGRFIGRIEMQTSLGQADVQTSADAISISFTDSSTSTPLRLQISCGQLDWQLSTMAQILNQFSHFLFRVEDLGIDTTEPPSGQDDVGGEQWAELIRAFGGTKYFRVAGVHVSDILCALHPAEGEQTTDTTVLPALRDLHAAKPMSMHGPSWDAVQSLITSRYLTGNPIQVNVPSYQCHICHASFGLQEGLKRHLRDKHTYRIVCSYCDEFECTLGYGLRFSAHLQIHHPKVARNDPLAMNFGSGRLAPSRLDSLVCKHGSLRAPDVAASSTTGTVPHIQ